MIVGAATDTLLTELHSQFAASRSAFFRKRLRLGTAFRGVLLCRSKRRLGVLALAISLCKRVVYLLLGYWACGMGSTPGGSAEIASFNMSYAACAPC
jgi:hypothetical protein